MKQQQAAYSPKGPILGKILSPGKGTLDRELVGEGPEGRSLLGHTERQWAASGCLAELVPPSFPRAVSNAISPAADPVELRRNLNSKKSQVIGSPQRGTWVSRQTICSRNLETCGLALSCPAVWAWTHCISFLAFGVFIFGTREGNGQSFLLAQLAHRWEGP